MDSDDAYARQTDTKSVNALEKLERSGSLSHEGKSWLIQNLDPFHDTEFPPTDTPDFVKQAGVVQCIKRTLTVGKAAAQEVAHPGENWDCHVVTLPILQNILTDPSTLQNTTIATIASNLTQSLYPVTVASVRPGALAFPSGVAYPNFWTTTLGGTAEGGYSGLSCASSVYDASATRPKFVDGPHRLVGYGIEVVNTSPPLTAQGSVTAYRQPQDIQSNFWITAAAVPLTGDYVLLPPGTAADAFLLEGTRQWAAKEGGYMISTPSATEQPIWMPRTRPMLLGQSRINSTEPNPVPVLQIQDFFPMTLHDHSTSGLVFGGLASTNTLTINVRFFVTRYPTPSESDMAVVARPSPEYDPIALEIFSHSMRQLPPACPVNENPLGEWFRKVVKTVGDVSSTLAPAVSHLHPGAGKVLGKVASVANSVVPKQVAPDRQVPATRKKKKAKA